MGDADRLPMANVSRIVQSSLPKDAAVAKEARVALSACATVFVHYITELAVQQCDKRKKVTLTPEDIVEALREAEFEDFEAPIKEALAQARNGGVAKKVGTSMAKKQKLDDSVNGADTPTRAEPDNKDGEDDAEDDGEAEAAANGGATGEDEKMEDKEAADEGKEDEDEGNDKEAADGADDAKDGAQDDEKDDAKDDA